MHCSKCNAHYENPQIRFCPNCGSKVVADALAQLTATTDYDAYTCHQAVLRKYPIARKLQVFIDTSAQCADSKMVPYVMPVVKSAMIFCLINEGKYREARVSSTRPATHSTVFKMVTNCCKEFTPARKHHHWLLRFVHNQGIDKQKQLLKQEWAK
jgi:hypothetical protein